jgi:hypothetical protein
MDRALDELYAEFDQTYGICSSANPINSTSKNNKRSSAQPENPAPKFNKSDEATPANHILRSV